jgi:predicted metalloprotease with PDZ domain
MRTDLLWVYEGLTQYLGYLLTSRSGLFTRREAQDHLALFAAQQDTRVGRRWRNLLDTAISAQFLFQTPDACQAWRRDADFYDEGLLIWLEVDCIIRRSTHGRGSIDDFCRIFFGGANGAPSLKTYTFDDVVSSLNAVAPYDWRTFLTTRLTSTGPHAPMEGIAAAGWRLVYTDSIAPYERSREGVRKEIDLRYSLGVLLKDGAVTDIVPDTPAAQAGVTPGMKIVAVNNRRGRRAFCTTQYAPQKDRTSRWIFSWKTGTFTPPRT